MTLPNIYQLTDVGTAPKFNEAFAAGVEAVEGERPQIFRDPRIRPGPIALWGEHKMYRQLQAAANSGVPWYYGDHAYFGRGIYFRVTKNALQSDGSYFDDGPEATRQLDALNRVRKKVPIHIEHDPKNASKGFILLCPPSEALSERSGFSQEAWTAQAVTRLKAVSKREIVIRQKPKINRTPAPLLEALKGAWCLVTYTSNAAIEAICGGYPAICDGPNPVNIFNEPKMENVEKAFVPRDYETRRQWVGALCRQQWTLDEIRAGDCWRAVR